MKTERIGAPRWAFAGGSVVVTLGAVFLVWSLRVSAGPVLLVSASAFALAAVVEFAAGRVLARQGGDGFLASFAGGLGAMEALVFVAMSLMMPMALDAAIVTLLLGIFALGTGLVGLLDLLIDRPLVAPRTAALQTVCSLAVGVCALATWRTSSNDEVGLLMGLVFAGAGIAVLGSALAAPRARRVSASS